MADKRNSSARSCVLGEGGAKAACSSGEGELQERKRREFLRAWRMRGRWLNCERLSILRVLYNNNNIIIISGTGELGDGDVCDLPPRRIWWQVAGSDHDNHDDHDRLVFLVREACRHPVILLLPSSLLALRAPTLFLSAYMDILVMACLRTRRPQVLALVQRCKSLHIISLMTLCHSFAMSTTCACVGLRISCPLGRQPRTRLGLFFMRLVRNSCL